MVYYVQYLLRSAGWVWNPCETVEHVEPKKKQGITNTLALPIDKMLYIYLLRPHSEHQKNPL
jgi:hypothetical protein